MGKRALRVLACLAVLGIVAVGAKVLHSSVRFINSYDLRVAQHVEEAR